MFFSGKLLFYMATIFNKIVQVTKLKAQTFLIKVCFNFNDYNIDIQTMYPSNYYS